MGVAASRIVEDLFVTKKQEIHEIQRCCVVVGLEGAGKTTFLRKLKLNDDINTISIIGLSIKTVEYKRISFVAFNVGGLPKTQPDLDGYYRQAQAIVFVVDSNNHGAITQAREELQNILKKDILKNATVLILANKQDLPDAMSTYDLVQNLDLHSISQRSWYIQASCTANGNGLYEGMEWLTSTLDKSSL